MTSGTGSICVLGVIESRVETAQRWKRLDLSTLNIRMTNRTNWTGRICELLRVTTRARRMCSLAGQGRLGRIVLTTMTKQTRKPRVIPIVVLELRVVG
jgi:hypothetical protein